MRFSRPIWATPAKVTNSIPMTQTELAEVLGISLPYLNQILKGRLPMTKSVATDLSILFGTDISVWLDADNEYRKAYFYVIKHKTQKRNPGFDNTKRRKLISSLDSNFSVEDDDEI